MKYFLILLLSCICPLIAQGVSPVKEDEKLSCLQGILFISNKKSAREEVPPNFRGVHSDDVRLLQKNQAFLSKLNDQYVGKPLSQKEISEIKEKVAQFYKSQNQPLVVISVPKQELTHGVLRIVVEEAKLGKVTTVGNCHFSNKWLTGAIRTKPGEAVLMSQVFEDISWLNLNPFRRTDAIFKPGEKPGTTDLELVTIDRWPYRFYMGGDNTGTIATNRNRLFFGFNFSKTLLKDGQISYQFTSAPNWNLFYSHTASARMPLPWRHIVALWGGYTQVKPHTNTPGLKEKGISWQVDARYRIPCFLDPHLMQTFVVGYDFKEANNYIWEGRQKIFETETDINQFMLGYELGYRNHDLRTNLVAEMYVNPGGITFANKSRLYSLLRYGAKSNYAYFKISHSLAQGVQWGTFTYDLTGQFSTTNLLPSEQLTMTGYNAVRGFEERILNLDNALIVNVAFETPHYSPAKRLGFCKQWDDLYFLAFFDYGIGANHKPIPNEKNFRNLASIGPGVRYQIDRYVTVRFDYGIQLWHSGFPNPTHSRYNFGAVLSY